jgi:hypothetical protein
MSKEPITEEEGKSAEVPDATLQRARNESAINLLNEWLADESGYDERVWPAARKAIAENALSSRKRFDD